MGFFRIYVGDVVDATQLTEAGYLGDDIKSIFRNLVDYDVLFVDEIDKKVLGSWNSNNENTNAHVISEFLKFIDGIIMGNSIGTLNTKTLLFVFAGAFEGIEDIAKKRMKSQGFGFGKQAVKPEETGIVIDDFMAYGMSREFAGRILSINIMNQLKREDINNILHKSAGSPVLQCRDMGKPFKIDVDITEEVIDELTELSMGMQTGLRAAKSLLTHKAYDEIFAAMKEHRDTIRIQQVRDPMKGALMSDIKREKD